jgi:hypothetical protein
MSYLYLCGAVYSPGSWDINLIIPHKSSWQLYCIRTMTVCTLYTIQLRRWMVVDNFCFMLFHVTYQKLTISLLHSLPPSGKHTDSTMAAKQYLIDETVVSCMSWLFVQLFLHKIVLPSLMRSTFWTLHPVVICVLHMITKAVMLTPLRYVHETEFECCPTVACSLHNVAHSGSLFWIYYLKSTIWRLVCVLRSMHS